MSVSHKRVVVSSSNAHQNSTPVFSFSLSPAGLAHRASIVAIMPNRFLGSSLSSIHPWIRLHCGKNPWRRKEARTGCEQASSSHSSKQKKQSSQALQRSDLGFLKEGMFFDGLLECVRVPWESQRQIWDWGILLLRTFLSCEWKCREEEIPAWGVQIVECETVCPWP